MKLKKCFIANFGTIHEQTIEFKDGLNIIKHDNGFGKTTIATFIKAMFYGLEARKTEKTDRKIYAPWQGGQFGGNLEFEVKGKTYRVERFFGNKPSEDTFKLEDVSTNTISKDYSENLGEEIFKINKEAYERSTYIPQGRILTQMDDSLRAKLSNVIESENDVNTSDKAISRLSEAMKYYKMNGNKGEINKKKNELSEMHRELENSKFDEQRLEEIQTKMEKINTEIKEQQRLKENKQKELTKKIEHERKLAKAETYKNLVQALKKCEEEYTYLKDFFKNGTPTKEELDKLSNEYSEAQKLKIEIENNNLLESEITKLGELQNKFLAKQISKEEIDDKIAKATKIQEIEADMQKDETLKLILEENLKVEQNTNKKEKRIGNILLVIGILLLLIGAIIPNFIIIGISAVFIVISIILKSKKTNSSQELEGKLNETNNNLSNLEKEKESINFAITEFISKFTTNIPLSYQEKILFLSNIKTEYVQYQELSNKRAKSEETKKTAMIREKQLEDDIQMYMSKYFTNLERTFLQLFQELNSNLTRFESVKVEYETKLKDKQDYEKENNIEDLENKQNYGKENNIENPENQQKHEKENEEINNIDEKELNKEIAEITEKIDELLDSKNQIKNQIETLENKIDEAQYLQNDIENIEETIKEYEKKYETLSKTKEFLEIAKQNFSKSYSNDMFEGFKKYIKLLDDAKLETYVDVNLNVQIDVQGSKKELKYFSTGYQDLMYICVRLGLIQALFKEESPFIVLDDPFVNLDDTKTSKALELLEKIAKDHQIIYLVCNSSRVLQ